MWEFGLKLQALGRARLEVQRHSTSLTDRMVSLVQSKGCRKGWSRYLKVANVCVVGVGAP